jgi:hypothetical protein
MEHFSNRAPSPVLRTPEVVVERRARVEAEEELEALRTKVKSMERHAAAISRATQHTKRQVKAIQAAKSQKATVMMRRERFRMQKQNMVRQRHQQLVLYRAESQQQRAARKRRAREEKRANAEAVKAMERDALASTNLNRTQWQREARSKGTAVRARLKSAHDTRISDLSAAQAQAVRRNAQRVEGESRRVLKKQAMLERIRAEEVELTERLRDREAVRQQVYQELQATLRATQ